MRGQSSCRACDSDSLRSILNLGQTPIANNLPLAGTVIKEAKYPLNFKICNHCNLGQVGEFETPDEIFTDYPYISSTSTSWLKHVDIFCSDMLKSIPDLSKGWVLELASNDGYLLSNFQKKGIKVLGVDPAKNIAQLAELRGVKTISDFFGIALAQNILKENSFPRLIVAQNVAAHVPDLIDFFGGISTLCDKRTFVCIENPNLGNLLEQNLFDTIYHEHFSYLSVESIKKLAERVGLELFKVEQLSTQGGSYRYWLRKPNDLVVHESVLNFQKLEEISGLGNIAKEELFSKNVNASIVKLQNWVNSKPDKQIIGYGAAAKTVTAFFAAKLDENKFKFLVDANKLKQGRRLPGTNIPILPLENLSESDTILIFPWNISEEIAKTIRILNPAAKIWVTIPLREIELN